MSYQVIARKWRPQRFSDVVFQDHVSRTLQNSISNGRISHAFIFSGPRGVGKTTMARILAKALNCAEGLTAEPCGVCDNCVEIKSGTAFDVIEIDGASNNGVEDIRELRENVNFAPVKCRYKVYIIDEVHMVTTQAFNALLKTLEEPPAHVIFIMATTEIHKVPDTILSRCQKFFFKKIPVDFIASHLKSIVEKEGYSIDETALFPLARAADGSMRDAQSLLDQVISFSSSADGTVSVSEDDALQILGIVPVESYIRVLQMISSHDRKGVIGEIDSVSSMGIDIPRYIDGFVEIVRALRLAQGNVELQNLMGLSSSEVSLIDGVSSSFSDEELSRFFTITSRLQRDMKSGGNDRVLVEMALLDMIAISEGPSISALIQTLQGAKAPATGEKKTVEPRKPVVIEKKTEPPVVKGADSAKLSALEEKDIERTWKEFVAQTAQSRQYLNFLLKTAKISISGREVTINYPAGEDAAYYSRILDTNTRETIKKELSERLGFEILISVGVMQQGEAQSAPPAVKDTPPVPDMTEQKPQVQVEKKNSVTPLRNEPEDFAPDVPPGPGVQGNDASSIGNSPAEKIRDAFNGKIVEKGE